MLSIIPIEDKTELPNGLYKLGISIKETDVKLLHRFVAGTIDWGDGSTTEIAKQAVVSQDQSAMVIYQHRFDYGNYDVKVSAKNYRYPTADTALEVFSVTRVNLSAKPKSTTPIIVGPILPRDLGFPNTSQWNFDVDFDLVNVESALKLLLITTKGERLMDPNFGTNLRRVIFEPSTPDVDSQIKTEITTAVETYAPFVSISSMTVTRNNPKQANVEVQFLRNTTRQNVIVNFQLER